MKNATSSNSSVRTHANESSAREHVNEHRVSLAALRPLYERCTDARLARPQKVSVDRRAHGHSLRIRRLHVGADWHRDHCHASRASRWRLAQALDILVKAAVMALFFLHGARLSYEAVFAGIAHWRLHFAVLSSTYLLFPLLGLVLAPLANAALGPTLALGVLFICCLPSTVQSSIAFTSIAHGNVPAAVVSASLSNILGIVLTPVLTGLLLARSGAFSGARRSCRSRRCCCFRSLRGNCCVPGSVGGWPSHRSMLEHRWPGARSC